MHGNKWDQQQDHSTEETCRNTQLVGQSGNEGTVKNRVTQAAALFIFNFFCLGTKNSEDTADRGLERWLNGKSRLIEQHSAVQLVLNNTIVECWITLSPVANLTFAKCQSKICSPGQKI